MLNSSKKVILFDLVGVLLACREDYQPVPLIEAVDTTIGHVVDDVQFKAFVLQTYQLTEVEFDNVLQAVVDKYVPFHPLWRLLPELREHYRLAVINNGTWL